MNYLKIIILHCLLSIVYCSLPTVSASNNQGFIENKGQITDTKGSLRSDILFTTKTNGATIYFMKDKISYVFTELEETNSILKGCRIDMELTGVNLDVNIKTDKILTGYTNYYYGHCPDGIKGVKSYGSIKYENIYPNIDMIFYYQEGNNLKYDILVKQGGNIEDIQLEWKGAEGMAGGNGIEIKEGKLHIKTSLGEIKEEIPEVYQIIEGKRVVIEAAYVLKGNQVSIEVGDYDKSKELIIDPWATYYGGSSTDRIYGIDIDKDQHVYITGETGSINFPWSVGAFQDTLAGGASRDAFIVKFDDNGNRIWATYYGGSGLEIGYEIKTDNNMDVVIVGHTGSSDFPVSAGAIQDTINGGNDMFILKFDNNGNRIWATYYGGSSFDAGFSVDVDLNNNIIFSGETWSTDFPVTGAAVQNSNAGLSDAVIVKFDPNGNVIWSTYYGGSGRDDDWVEVAVDGNGNIVVTGSTQSLDFPVTAGAVQPTFGGGVEDVFVVKFDSTGDTLWATYYGGVDGEHGQGVAVDGNNNILITGATGPNFPVTSNALQPTPGGISDGFIIKLDPNGDTLWVTFYGGGGGGAASIDNSYAIAVDGNDNVLITGLTRSASFPVTPGAFRTTLNSGASEGDAFAAKIDKDGTSTLCATYYGGSAAFTYDFGRAITSDTLGNIIFAGYTPNVNFPVMNEFQPSSGGFDDGFVVWMSCNCTMDTTSLLNVDAGNDTTICVGDSVQLNASGGTDYSWSPQAGLSDPTIANPFANLNNYLLGNGNR